MSTVTKMRSAELAQRFGEAGPKMYRDAYDRGMSLSAFLEEVVETRDDGLDAFEGLLKEQGIVTRSKPEFGLWAVPFDRFYRDENARALLPEWWARQWRKVSMASREQRSALLSSDTGLNTWSNAYADAANLRVDSKVEAAIPLMSLIAMTTPINAGAYRAAYLTQEGNEASLRMYRTGEAAEVPTTKLVEADRSVNLYKYGRSLDASYEVLRRQRVDKIALMIQLMAVQAEVDKVATVIDVMVNGDGNSGTAGTVHDLTTLDSAASAGTLTLKGWLAFQMKFANPYMLNIALMQEAVALQLTLLSAGTANWPIVAFGNSPLGGVQPINQNFAGAVPIGWTSDAPSLKIVGADARFAVERVTEIGADLAEVERFTKRQIESLTLTETEGYAIMDSGAVQVLDVNA
jgi:hypothetical protein